MLDLGQVIPVRSYEAVIIMHPDSTEAEMKKFFSKNREILKGFKGDYASVDLWGKRRLANPIRRLKMGVYFHAYFEGEAPCIAELERTARINDRVLRFLHTKLDERSPLSQHIEKYRDVLKLSTDREREREEKMRFRKQARRPVRGD